MRSQYKLASEWDGLNIKTRNAVLNFNDFKKESSFAPKQNKKNSNDSNKSTITFFILFFLLIIGAITLFANNKNEKKENVIIQNSRSETAKSIDEPKQNLTKPNVNKQNKPKNIKKDFRQEEFKNIKEKNKSDNLPMSEDRDLYKTIDQLKGLK